MPNDRPDYVAGSSYITVIIPNTSFNGGGSSGLVDVSPYESVQVSLTGSGGDVVALLELFDALGQNIYQTTLTGTTSGTTYDCPANAAQMQLVWVSGNGTVNAKGSGLNLDGLSIYGGDGFLGDLGFPAVLASGSVTTVAGVAISLGRLTTGGLNSINFQCTTAAGGFLQLLYNSPSGAKGITVISSPEMINLPGAAVATLAQTKLLVLPYGVATARWFPGVGAAAQTAFASVMRER